MKNYERPTVIAALETAEGVYMLSGDNMVTLEEVFEPITDPDGAQTEVADAETPADGLETSVGGTQTETGVEGEITETPADGETEAGEVTQPAEPEEAGTQAAEPEETAPEAVESGEEAAETGEMQGSLLINCDSRYMNGVWQGTKEGAWGGIKLGCKELLGCTGCPADNGDGCGLQKTDSDQYFKMIGTLMPAWEASGKGPNDDPYGI